MGKRIDAVNQSILDILSRNARTSVSDIARRIGKSRTAVVARIARMEDAGIIQAYCAVLDNTSSTEIRNQAYLVIKHTGGADCASVWQQIRHFKGIREGHSLFGDIDLIIKINYAQFDELVEIKQLLSADPRIREVTISPILRSWLPAISPTTSSAESSILNAID